MAQPAATTHSADRQLIDRFIAERGVTKCPGFGEGPAPHYENRFDGLSPKKSRELMKRESWKRARHDQRMRRLGAPADAHNQGA